MVILILLFLTVATVNAQIGLPVEPSLPDTVYIQFLSKSGGEVNKSYISPIENELSTYEVDYEFHYYNDGAHIRYILACWSETRLHSIQAVRKYYQDAYFIDKNGWRVKYE